MEMLCEDSTTLYSNISVLFLFYFDLRRGHGLSELAIIPPTAEEKILVLHPTRCCMTHSSYETNIITFHLTHPYSLLHDRPRTKHRTADVGTMGQHEADGQRAKTDIFDHIKMLQDILCNSLDVTAHMAQLFV